jgi:hypothetical protein
MLCSMQSLELDEDFAGDYGVWLFPKRRAQLLADFALSPEWAARVQCTGFTRRITA